MTQRAILRECRSLGLVNPRQYTQEQLAEKLLELRKIRDDLADEESSQPKLIGWRKPKSPGLPWTPIMESR